MGFRALLTSAVPTWSLSKSQLQVVIPSGEVEVSVNETGWPTNAADGENVKLPTGSASVTVISEPSLRFSTVAVIVACREAPISVSDTAVTRPPETVATLASLVDQVTTQPESGLPSASRGVAVSWSVPPSATLTLAGDTSIELTAAQPGPTPPRGS